MGADESGSPCGNESIHLPGSRAAVSVVADVEPIVHSAVAHFLRWCRLPTSSRSEQPKADPSSYDPESRAEPPSVVKSTDDGSLTLGMTTAWGFCLGEQCSTVIGEMV